MSASGTRERIPSNVALLGFVGLLSYVADNGLRITQLSLNNRV
jgi:hypothetical protein